MAKKQAAKTAEVIDLVPATSEDEQLVQSVGVAILDFLKRVGTFFAQANALERAAKDGLAVAQTWALPTSGSDDLVLQERIRKANEDRRVVMAHWEITTVVHKLHRRLTARRAVAEGALEETANIGNRLHNTYVEGEKRRAAAEEERLRRAAEQEARERRDREAAEAEAQAVALEESAPSLSEREQRFVELVAYGLNSGETAARTAGFKEPMKSAARLLTLAKIQKAIRALKEAQALRQQAEARKAQPVHVQVETVRPDIQRAAGSADVTTWSGECLDEAATVEAFRSGQYGIPGDLFMVNPKKANEYARSLHERLNLWPGMRATSKTSVRG